MPLIPKEDQTNEETVTNAKAALESREQVEAALRSRLEAASARVKALTIESEDLASDVHIAEAEQADDARLTELRETRNEKLEALAAEKIQVESLTHAVAKAAAQSGEARMALARIQNQNHINRISKLLERMLAEVVRLENHIDSCSASWKKINEHLVSLHSTWPGDQLNLDLLNPAGALWSLVELQIYKSSAVCLDPHLGYFVEAKGASRFPGAKCNDVALQNPEKIRSLSDQVDEVRRHLMDILHGRKDGRTGQLTAKGIEAASVTRSGIELKDGRPVGEEAPIHQPTLQEKLAAAALGKSHLTGADLKQGVVIPADVTPAS
jgi:hypothetical protein